MTLGLGPSTCRSIAGVFLLAVELLLTSVLGCAAPAGYRVSQQMMEEENYDQAVVKLRQLVAEDPANSRYQLLLGEAESKAADRHMSRAKELRSQHRPRDAQEELKTVLDLVPAHPEAVVMAQEVTEEIRSAIVLAEQAQGALGRSAYQEAVQLADQALAIDQTLRATQQVRDKALDSAVRIHSDRAREALNARQWDACLAEAARIRALNKTDLGATAIEEQVTNRQQALRLYESTRQAVREGHYIAAIGPLRESASLWPENDDLSRERDRVTRLAVERFVTQAQAELNAEKYAAAINVFDRALLIVPADQSLIQRRREAVARWAECLIDRYERRALAGEWEQAWRQAVQALVICPAVRERVSQDLSRAEGKIREDIAYNMSVLPLKSATVGADGIQSICQALIEALGTIKPDHVQLLERANLSEILTEHDLSLANISESTPLNELGRKLPGIDVFLFVDVSAQESQDRQVKAPGTSKYLAGKENVRNPDYAKAEQTLDQTKKTLDRARSRALVNEMMWDAAGRRDLHSEPSFLRKAITGYYGLNAQRAAEDYNVALMKLHDTPQWIERDRWQPHRYPIYRVKREVSVKVRLRLVEVATGRILWSDNEIVGQASDTDTLIEPDSAHNVPSKTVALKDASVLQAQAIERVIPSLRVKARELLSRRAAAYVEDAQKSTGEAAVANYVRYLFGCGPHSDPRTVASALDEVFRSQVSGKALEECKRVAAERLGLTTDSAETEMHDQTVVTSAPAASESTTSKVLVSTQPADHVAPTPAPSSVSARKAGERRPVARTAEVAKQALTHKPTTVRVLEASVSRDDDRYPKQLQLSDGITVKVSDTDGHPLDADLEIRVGSQRRKYKDLRIGAKIPIRGLSGDRYDISLLAIEDHTETVRFALDHLQIRSNRRVPHRLR